MWKLLPGLIIAILVVGCASTRTPYIPPVDTNYRVRINTQFESLPNATRINFQGGERIRQGNLDKWTTYCKLFVYNGNREADYVTSVSPGEFEIVKVDIRYDSVDSLNRPWGYASLDWERRDPPAFYLYKIGMRLTSADQPDVVSLNCYKKWGTRGRHYPTLTEIRQALGGLIEIGPESNSN